MNPTVVLRNPGRCSTGGGSYVWTRLDDVRIKMSWANGAESEMIRPLKKDDREERFPLLEGDHE